MGECVRVHFGGLSSEGAEPLVHLKVRAHGVRKNMVQEEHDPGVSERSS